MISPRTTYRAAFRAALASSSDLSGVAVMKAWALPSDGDDLPALTVLTPREVVRADGVDIVSRLSEIVVVMKVIGDDDIEDLMDGYAVAIEEAGIACLQALEPQPALFGVTGVDTKVEGGARRRVGTIEVRFSAERYAAEGEQV